jgi:hypothetical protein
MDALAFARATMLVLLIYLIKDRRKAYIKNLSLHTSEPLNASEPPHNT